MRDLRTRLRLVVAGLRWRSGASAALVAVAVVAVAAGAFGPLYLQGADQTIVQATLAAAPVGNSGLTLQGAGSQTSSSELARALALVPRAPAGGSLFGSPLRTTTLPVGTVAENGQPYQASLVARTDVCAHLNFVQGGCPVAHDAVAVSGRTARELGLRPGDVLVLQLPRTSRRVALRISGLYRPGTQTDPFWWGENYFPFGSASPVRPFVDDFFTSAATLSHVAPPGQATRLAQLALRIGDLRSTGVAAFEQTMADYRRQVGAFGIDASTSVGQLFDQAATDQHTSTTIVAVVDLQLVLLSLMILYFVAARTAEAREPDVRLAELRGFAPAGISWVALVGPLVLLVVAVPLGLAAAWLVARALAPRLFAAGVAPHLTMLALGAALLTLAAGSLAVVLGARSLMARRSGGRSSGLRLGLALDAAAVAIALAAFAEVAVGGVSSADHTDPLAALAPGLLAFGAGVLGARLLPLATATTLPLTADSRWLGTSFATRRVARRPPLSRQIVVLALAVGLATFAVAGWAVAGSNRTTQSEFAVGANRVLDVEVRPGVNFLEAVRTADRSGRQAMAVVVEDAPDGTLLAVDAARFAAVASWPPGLTGHDAAQIAGALHPPTAPTVTLRGSGLRVTADLSQPVPDAPELQATVFDDAYQTSSTLDLGPLRPGVHNYEAPTAGACTGSCRLVSLGVTWSPDGLDPGQSTRVPLVIHSIADRGHGDAWVSVPAALGDPARWQSSTGGVGLGRSAGALRAVATVDADGAATTFGPADVPAALPSVVTGDLAQPGAASAVGLDGATIATRPITTVPSLPGVGADAAMVDLTLAQRLQTGPMLDTNAQVWLSSSAGPDLIARLADAGVTTVGVHTATAADAFLSSTGVGLAYRFFVMAALAAAALAVGSTAFSLVVSARRRRGEMAALQAVGVGAGPLRRSVGIEQGIVIATGMALGVGAGLGAAVVALPSVPEFVDLAAGPPLTYQLPWPALGVMVALVALALGATVALSARLMVSGSSLDHLGEDE